ncbi:hypothetical protein NPIL_28191 [Nephila pilipes]|uniref:Uncharacterized protein n=1 Tax=Nephila pilipes TaxID=299642 RepID=A0A8X6TQG2_NEPPI|nr:hypothetical protein NPIL_28191 [Nephila pilipes]
MVTARCQVRTIWWASKLQLPKSYMYRFDRCVLEVMSMCTIHLRWPLGSFAGISGLKIGPVVGCSGRDKFGFITWMQLSYNAFYSFLNPPQNQPAESSPGHGPGIFSQLLDYFWSKLTVIIAQCRSRIQSLYPLANIRTSTLFLKMISLLCSESTRNFGTVCNYIYPTKNTQSESAKLAPAPGLLKENQNVT